MIADYNLRKKYHYCTKCGKQDAYTLNGRARCYECQQKANLQQRNHPEYNKQHSIQKKRLYSERKEAGLCVVCGNIAEKGRVRCLKHLYKDRKYHKTTEINRDIARNIGICMTCLKEPCVDGKKICKNCYDKTLVNLEKARAAINVEERKPFLFGKALYEKMGRAI